jgi:transposase
VIGPPSLAALDHSTSTRIWLATAPADIRCGFERLAELAQVVTNQNPMDGHLFLFRGRSGDRLKILYWDRDGYALWYKRLEEGVFKLPRIDGDAKSVELRASELAMMLDGIDLRSVKRVKRYSRKKVPV